MNRYVRLCNSLHDFGTLVKPEEVLDIVDSEKDYYTSLFYYNDQQYKKFLEAKSVKGIKDVTTDKVWFDFDSKTDLVLAQHDAIECVKRLNLYGIASQDIEVYFSGGKGFNVIVTVDRQLTPDEVYHIAVDNIGKMFDKDKKLKTLDTTMYDAVQILRVPGTRHQKSGLYKIPISLNDLQSKSVSEIKKMASSLDNVSEYNWNKAVPNEAFFKQPPKKEPKIPTSVDNEFDLSKKPSQWRNCKWSLLQGNFKEGERHQALLVIAATCRGLGYDKDTTYYMCKSALKKQAALSGQEEFPKEELYSNIIEQSVFTDNWEGGQYTCQKPGWLQTYCQSLGEHACKAEDVEAVPIIRLEDMSKHFETYATNFEQNIIKTGIRKLDDNVMLCASTLNGLLGQPGAGKTSMSLNYLRNTSMNDVNSTFFSLDMGMPIVFAKLVQKKTGLPFKAVLDLFKTDPTKAARITAELREEYKNVGFNYKSGLTVPDMRNIVTEQEQQTGKEVKLVIIDYLERIAGPYSDPTANSGFIANQLTDMANDMGKCVLLLLQTQKHSTPDISDPLLSLKGVKGSSLIEQSCSTILTLWRDGYNPKTVEDDKYISFAVVKNRFGSLWSGDFAWNGVKGDIREMTEEEELSLMEFKKAKAEMKAAAESASNRSWE